VRGQTQFTVVTEIFLFVFDHHLTDKQVIFRIGPGVSKREIAPAFGGKVVLKSQLVALFASRCSVLLQRDLHSTPLPILFPSVDRQMSLLEQFELVAHVDDAESNSRTLRNAFH
jgi:hypothetical protein